MYSDEHFSDKDDFDSETFASETDKEGKFYDDLQEKIQAKQKEIEDLKEYMDKVAYGRSELLELDSLEKQLAELEGMEFMGAETFEANPKANKCFICSKPATKQRGFTNQHTQEDGEGTKPRITDKDGNIWFCKAHDNLYDFGLFSAGNLLSWTHPNGTKYVQGRLLKDAETFNAERQVYVLRFSDPMRYGQAVEIPFLTKNEAERYVDMHIRPYNRDRPHNEIIYSITKENQSLEAETFESYNPPLEEITASCDKCGKSFPAKVGRGTGQADSRIYFGNGKEIGLTSRNSRTGEPILSCKECWETMSVYEWNPPPSLFDAETFEAKGIDTLAKPFEEIGIPKTYARLGVITAGITALAFGVMKLKDR